MADLTGNTISHYRILSRLGQGGMGEVYVALDSRLGRKVALKFLKSDLLHEPQARRRFEFEARAAAILSHPNITALFEFDAGEGFMSLEYVEGRTLEQALADGPMSPLDAVRVGIAVSRGLGHAHGRNVVHRDLKPSNILMGNDGSIKLTDFGLAKVRDATMRTTTGVVLGTASYMCPEQIRGLGMDRRGDLFALGVVLHRTVTGSLPWKGEGVGILYSILHDEPPPIPESVAPRFLTALLERLMRKEPADRFASAEEVETNLLDAEDLLAGTSRAGVTAPPQASAANAGPSTAPPIEPTDELSKPVRRMPIVGRERELGRLRDVLDEARRGNGRTLFLSGEAGAGKSRIMEEFRGYAETNGVFCLTGRCTYQGGRNFEPFVESLEEFARRASSRGRTRLELSQAYPSLAAVLPTLELLLEPGGGLTPEPRSREHLWTLLDSLLKSIAHKEPLVLFLDDLHWADEGTLSLLNHITRNMAKSHLLIVASYRPEEVIASERGEHPLNDLIRLLSPVETFETMPVGPLDEDGTTQLLSAAGIEERLGRRLARTVHRRSMGNPFFTIEIMRLLAGGSVPGPTTGRVDSDIMPQTITDVLMRRLTRLSPEERDILEVAAVEGDVFHTDTLASGTGLPRITLLKRLRSLGQTHHLITAVEEGYRFSHGLIRDVLLRGMTPELRREYHAVVAAHLVPVYGDRADYAGSIGHHLFKGGKFGEALPFLVRAAEEARRLFLNDRALQFCEQALEAFGRAGATSVRRTDLLRSKCEILLLLGRPEAARAAAEEAVQEDKKNGDDTGHAASLEWLGEAALAQGDHTSAEKTLTKAYERYQKMGDLRHVAQCDRKLGALAARRGDYDVALTRLDTALDTLKKESDERGVALIRLEAGEVWEKRGDYPRAAESFGAGVEVLRRLGDKQGLARGLNRLGNVRFHGNDTEGALRHYEEALSVAIEIDDLQGTALLQANLGNVHLTRGDLERALSSYEEALSRFEEIGDYRGTSQILVAIGNVHFIRGHFEEAAHHYRRSIEGREKMGDRWGLGNSLDNLGVVEYYLGQWGAALEHAGAALRLRSELGDRPGQAESALNLGNLFAVLGDLEAAENYYRDAVEAASAVGDRRREARAMLSRACLCLWNDARDQAAALLCEVRDRDFPEPAIRCRVLLLTALLPGPAGRDGPENTLREALDLAFKSGSIAEAATIHLALGQILLYAGRREESLREIEIALSLTDAGRIPLLELRALKLQAALTEGEGHAAARERAAALEEHLGSAVPAEIRAGNDFRRALYPLP